MWTTVYAHDGSGYLTGAAIADERPRTVTLVNDAGGRVLQRDEEDAGTGTGDPRQLHYYMNGVAIGDISNNGSSNTDYTASIGAHAAGPAYGPFRGGASTGVAFADFDQSYDAINGLSYDGTAQPYTVQAGDTLASIAQTAWGDASLWYLIAEGNGLSGAETLATGQVVTLPNKVHNLHHTADTWRPYDPNEAQGDLSPTDAKKPKGSKCGVFGQILQTIVAVAVTILLTPEIGPVGAAMAGNSAGQLFGMAAGIQRGFNFKSLAITGITAGLTQGMSQLASVGDTVKVGLSLAKATSTVNTLGSVGRLLLTANRFVSAARSMLVNATTQGIALVTHLQKRFDFAGVAAAGVNSAVSGRIRIPGIEGRMVNSMAGGLANAATRSLIAGTDFGDNLIAALPDIIGQTVGDEVGSEIRGAFGSNGRAQIAADRALTAEGKFTNFAVKARRIADYRISADFSLATGFDRYLYAPAQAQAQTVPQIAPDTVPVSPRPQLRLVPPAPPPAAATLVEDAALAARGGAVGLALAYLFYTPPAGGKDSFKLDAVGDDVVFDVTTETTHNNVVISRKVYGTDLPEADDNIDGSRERSYRLEQIGTGDFDGAILTVQSLDQVENALGRELPSDRYWFQYDGQGHRTASALDPYDLDAPMLADTHKKAGLNEYQSGAIIEDRRMGAKGSASAPKGANPAFVLGDFTVGDHGNMPSPRQGQESHHGMMSAWMKAHFEGYDSNLAPAILMPAANHKATYGVYLNWRAEQRRGMGGSFEWSKVSESDMRGLSERMFDAARVPTPVRNEYWLRYDAMKKALSR